jgi:hypothetical protein
MTAPRPPRMELEPPIQAMVDATNRGDSEALLNAFDEHAVLIDWGRTFTGRTEIALWNSDENIGTQNRLSITGVNRSDEGVVVRALVTGKGFRGVGTLTFQLGPNGITRLTIT